ncbi:SMC-Scp complex subunit ScpB [Clostridium gasigenes]|uniref:Segregation and condensation protein B n=1 Tax=Clostridium gasigenes TaxID=94869 RepID=A0A1H0N119_9CLOT|nr:SMC-Scp complex subunit ScpB [Clostridium gasigenes]MBB6625203.1 segregation/condensation protein B [Clostridium gasigenes]MBB6716207.1 segregation/condensation protein B [Clostridium gasigenes]MBU3087395.1 segregation/condensation protein B [Clostridium gasigenes]MBU3102932.1 segregation/condensation protein B [Clostridium gasigenes]MBU3106645.1 segregation/condensation protein B [Clostridium gasigenes]
MDSLYIKQYEFEETARTTAIKSVIESLLFVSGEPLSIRDLHNNLEISIKVIESVIKEMVHDYEEDNRGIKLISINGEYQLVSKPQNSDSIQKLLKKNKRQSLSQASLESLAIVAYKQPITRIDIDEIRGVKSDSALQRLIERELIKDIGRLEVPGRPIIFGTTEEFLRQFGLKDLDELPSLDLYDEKDDDEIEGSIDLLNKAMETL